MKPICVPCKRFFKCAKNGFYFIEGMPTEDGAAPGNAAPEKWKPYKLWDGDRWECPGCGASIVVGTGRVPVAEHFQPDFEKTAKRLGAAQLQVNDC